MAVQVVRVACIHKADTITQIEKIRAARHYAQLGASYAAVVGAYLLWSEHLLLTP